jgi:drug/metabolite transporter (DMT)-like permease
VETLKPPSDQATASATLRRAVWLGVAGEGILTAMDTVVKGLTTRYPIFEIAFLRFTMGTVVALLVVAVLRPGLPTRDALRVHSLRAFLSVLTAITFFYGLSKMPLAEAMALSFLSPLFIALFGVVLLKERFDSLIGIALAAGIAGMLIIVSGQFSGATYSTETLKGAAAITISAIGYGLVIVLLRARATIDPLPLIVVLQNIGPALLLAIPAMLVWQTPTPADLGLFLVVGLLGVGGHTCLANAFARAEAARLAPVHYTILLWGIVFGYLAFGDIPGITTLIGAALIAAATLLSQRR